MAFKDERFSSIVNTLVEVSRRIRESTRRKVPFRPIVGPAMAKFMQEQWGYTAIDVKDAK